MVKNNLSPVWEPFKVSLSSLCSCEEARTLKVGDGAVRGCQGAGLGGWGPGTLDHTGAFMEVRFVGRGGPVGGGGEGGSLAGGRMETPRLAAPEGQAG